MPTMVEGKEVRVEHVDGMTWVYVTDLETLTGDFNELVGKEGYDA